MSDKQVMIEEEEVELKPLICRERRPAPSSEAATAARKKIKVQDEVPEGSRSGGSRSRPPTPIHVARPYGSPGSIKQRGARAVEVVGKKVTLAPVKDLNAFTKELILESFMTAPEKLTALNYTSKLKLGVQSAMNAIHILTDLANGQEEVPALAAQLETQVLESSKDSNALAEMKREVELLQHNLNIENAVAMSLREEIARQKAKVKRIKAYALEEENRANRCKEMWERQSAKCRDLEKDMAELQGEIPGMEAAAMKTARKAATEEFQILVDQAWSAGWDDLAGKIKERYPDIKIPTLDGEHA